jgi:2,4-dienoyl-CoA reductase-like NADH-dependent reductase (Old Yellow Enzyme family)
MTTPLLFSPLSLGRQTLTNRIMISPMCQYSAHDGNANDWHLTHLGSLAISGAGLLCVEATAVSAEGRITHGCLGLYNDANQAALQKTVDAIRAISPVKLAIQLSHAGRKASSQRPWEGGALIPLADGGWQPLGPSAVAHKSDEAAPIAMDEQDIAKVIADFAAAARRARALGFEAIEVHCAHGYLLHEFLSPLANQRQDAYGGSLENRLRLSLQVFEAVREAAGPDIAVGARLSATDWVEGGWDVAQSIELAKRLQAMGADFLDISSGGVSPLQKITLQPGYQVPLAAEIKKTVSIPVISVGLITQAAQAEAILQDGQADMVALARAFLVDPRWPWRAAAELGGIIAAPQQFYRCLPAGFPAIFGEIKTAQR